MNSYQETILWIGLGLVLIILLTDTSVHNLLFKGGNQSTTNPTITTSPKTGTTNKSAANRAASAAANSANTITEINIPGIGPVFALQKAADALKNLLHL